MNDPTPDRYRALHLLEAADFLRDAHFRDGLSVQEIGTALRNTADEADPMVGSLARDGFGPDEIADMLAEPAAPPSADQPALRDRAAVLTVREKAMLGFALEMAQEEIHARMLEFADDDQNALTSLQRLAAETAAPATQAEARPTRYTVNPVAEHADPGDIYAITVDYRGDDRWAVLRHGLCLSDDGKWDRERVSSEREEEWLDTHRFDLTTAKRLATEQATDLAPSKWRGRGSQPQHVGGNAEDCPACSGTNPPYPFTCPGPAAVPAVGQTDEEA